MANPTHIIMVNEKDSPSQEVLAQRKETVKKEITSSGGKIVEEYTLIPGFAVTFPKDGVNALSAHPDVGSVEVNQDVRTQ